MELDDLVESSVAGASPATIVKFEQRIGIALPAAVKDLARHANGAVLKKDAVLALPDGSSTAGFRILSLDEIGDHTNRLLGGFHTDWIVWMRDDAGNAFCMDTRGVIAFWDQDTRELLPFDARLPEFWTLFHLEPSPARERSETPSATGAPLDALLARRASSAEVESFLGTSLSPALEESYMELAIRYDRADVVMSLQRLGARPDHGLVLASRLGKSEILGALLECGASPDVFSRGLTPLMAAATNGQASAVDVLLSHGADVSLVNSQGLDAKQIARICGHGAIAERLAGWHAK